MANIYEMTEQVQMLYDLLQAEEIDEQTFNDTVEGMGAIDKVLGYCQIINDMLGDIDKFKIEIDRLTKRKKTLENRVEYLKSNLLAFYNANGNQKITAGTFTVSTRKSEKTIVTNQELLTDEYLTVKVTPNLTEIKKAIKSGKEVAGAILEEKENIQIK